MNVHQTTTINRNLKKGDLTYLWHGIFILWALFMMDVITTGVILSLGGLEMNIFMRPFVESPIIHIALKMTVLGTISVIAYLSDRMTDRYGTLSIMIIAAWYIFVVSHNIIQMAMVVS